jgi:hypothetical protein
VQRSWGQETISYRGYNIPTWSYQVDGGVVVTGAVVLGGVLEGAVVIGAVVTGDDVLPPAEALHCELPRAVAHISVAPDA